MGTFFGRYPFGRSSWAGEGTIASVVTSGELLIRVSQSMPGALMRDFFAVVNGEVGRIARRRGWRFYLSELSVTPGLTLTGGVVTNGSTLLTESSLPFLAGHVNANVELVSLDGTREYHTIVTFTDEGNVELDSAWEGDSATGVTVTLYQRDWVLPSNFSRIRSVFESSTGRVMGPTSYAIGVPLSNGAFGVQFGGGQINANDVTWPVRCSVALDTSYSVQYLRRPTRIVSPADTVDVPQELDEAVYWAVIGTLAARDMKQYQGMYMEAKSRLEEEIRRVAILEDSTVMERRQNERVLI